MGGLSIWHVLLLLAVAMLLFGAGRVSEMGKGLGEGIRNFKKGLKDDDDEPRPKRAPPPEEEEDVEVQVIKVPKKLEAPKKKRVIQIEVDEDADEEEIARQIAKKRATTDEKAS